MRLHSLMIYMKVVKRVNPKSSHQKQKKFFFYTFDFVSIQNDSYSLNSFSLDPSSPVAAWLAASHYMGLCSTIIRDTFLTISYQIATSIS